MTTHTSPIRYVNYDPTTGLFRVHATCRGCGAAFEYVRRSAQGRKIEYCSPQCVNDHNEERNP